MLQILIPTDLQAEAKPGIRFVLHFSKTVQAKLIFVYVAYIPRPTGWSDQVYESFSKIEKKRHQQKLERMIQAQYELLQIRPVKYECLVLEGFSPETAILDYCDSHSSIDLICMATKGAAGLHRLWGTHSGNILTKSPVPVIVVPSGYRRTAMKTALYCTDLKMYETEIGRLAPLIGKMGVKLVVLHMLQPDEVVPNRHLFEQVLQKQLSGPVEVVFSVMQPGRSIAANIREQVRLHRVSLVIMFTDQTRGSLEKLIFPSQAEKLAFDTTSPLLVYAK